METQIANNIKLKVLVLVALLLVFAGISEVFSQTTNIYRIQSLFLYNFTKHVKWANTEGVFTVGVYGNPKAFAEIKNNLSGKMVWGEQIDIVEISSPVEMAKCHIAYMPKSSRKKILDLIDGSDLSNTLLVTEDDLINDGAAISFVYEHSKMKFKISKSKIEQAGLKVSSSLVSIGMSV